MNLTLDVNTEIYPLSVGERIKLMLTNTLEGEQNASGEAVWEQVRRLAPLQEPMQCVSCSVSFRWSMAPPTSPLGGGNPLLSSHTKSLSPLTDDAFARSLGTDGHADGRL